MEQRLLILLQQLDTLFNGGEQLNQHVFELMCKEIKTLRKQMEENIEATGKQDFIRG